MANSFFQFKQFTIWQDKCAMKVGTDGVLLGAWAETAGVKNILDVGTGTGLVSLMLAQRCDARILALEIDKQAVLQASENVGQSPWKDRIEVICEDFRFYKNKFKFDLIVSNPPYFSGSLKSPYPQRNLARHRGELTFKEFIMQAAELLDKQGHVSLIVPATCRNEIREAAALSRLYACKITEVCTRPGIPPKRILIDLSFTEKSCIQDKIVLELDRHVYSEEYISLTQEYYLKL